VLESGMRQLLSLLLLGVACARADVLNLANGDRFIGEVQSLNEKEIQLKSDALGDIKIPREKIASIFFGTNQPPVRAVAPESATAVKSGLDAKAVEDVQKEFLATATPEANAMFTELVQGLASGKLSVNDIRKQAGDTLKELRDLQAELGEDEDSGLLKSYVSILEKFVRAGGTNRPASATKPAAPPAKKSDEE
jgi:hypothetical protein